MGVIKRSEQGQEREDGRQGFAGRGKAAAADGQLLQVVAVEKSCGDVFVSEGGSPTFPAEGHQ